MFNNINIKIKRVTNKNAGIQLLSETPDEYYRKISFLYDKKNVNYFTYTPEQDKALRGVLRNLSENVTI